MTNDVLIKVQQIIADVLELDLDEISTDSALVDDLNADSLDVVDLSFSLGKKLKIQMPKKSVIMHAEEILGDLSKVVENSRLTALGAELLQQSPNKYSAEEAKEGTPVSKIYTETKVVHWANLCEEILETEMTGDELIIKRLNKVLTSQVA
jgi:acyl carrier protein